MKKILFFILTIAMCITLAACGKKTDKTTRLVNEKDWVTPGMLLAEYKEKDKKISIVKMTYRFKDDDGKKYMGYMTFVMFNDLAPISTANFVKLADNGFYNNLTITRVVTTDLIQGGDPEKTTLSDKKAKQSTIKGEFEENDVYNNLSHRRGVISMARTDVYDSASSQFFIVQNTFTSADSNYAAFGWLLEELKADGSSYTTEERNNTKTDDGYIVLYDYDCLDKICSLNIMNDASDGAPVQLVEIVEASVAEKNINISTSQYIK